MKKLVLLLICSGVLSVASVLAQSPPSAETILNEAKALAARDGKNVFILFHASWCGWCRKMDTAMNDKAIKKYFDDNYVIRHLVVHESDQHKNLENPGAQALLTKYHGDDSGIPYWLIFDKNGNLLADSKMRAEGAGPETGSNSGCPASEEEVNHFIKVLKQTSSIQDAGLALIRKRFRENESH